MASTCWSSHTVYSVDGWQSIYDSVVMALWDLDPKLRGQLLELVLPILRIRPVNGSDVKAFSWAIRPRMSDILDTHQESVQEFMAKFTTSETNPLFIHS